MNRPNTKSPTPVRMSRHLIRSIAIVLASSLLLIAAGCTNVRASSDPFAVDGPTPPPRIGFGRLLTTLGEMGDAIGRGVSFLGREEPQVLARRMTDDTTPAGQRRDAISRLAGYRFARTEPYRQAYASLARRESDPLVRATAVRALNRSGAREHGPLLIELLDDEAAAVRLEAAKALGNLPDPAAAQRLLALALAEAEDLDVRMAAVEALRWYDDAELVRGLGRLLEGRDFSLAWQARRTLIDIVGEDHGYDADAFAAASV